MALVYESNLKGPTTHALVIGVGAYPHIPDSALPAASPSAAHVANWLLTDFHNPSEPLATLEMLVSAPGVAAVSYTPPGTTNPLALKVPDTRAAALAAMAWFNRVGDHPDNIALFYFIGRGLFHQSDVLLLFGDAIGPGRLSPAISLEQLAAGIEAGGGRRSAYFLETGWNPADEPGEPEELLRSVVFSKGGDSQRALYQCQFRIDPTPTASGYGGEEAPSPFAFAVTEAMDEMASGPDARIVDTVGLGEALHNRVSGPCKLRIPPLGNFRLHYPPRPDPASESGGQEGGGADGEAAAPILPEDGPDPAPAADAPAAAPRPSGGGPDPTQAAAKPTPTPARPQQKLKGGAGAKPSPPPAAPVKAAKSGGAPKPPSPPPPAPKPPPPPPPPPSPPPGPAPAERLAATEFVPDDAETERDELGRGTLAVALARRLHKIWRQANGLPDPPATETEADAAADAAASAVASPPPAAGGEERAAFVVHLDAPWGGGKTSFANFVARVLNPYPNGAREAALFLRKDRAAGTDLGGLFLADPPADEAAAKRLAGLPEDARRPWITVGFNAWQAEHIAPPWWVFYQSIRKGCFAAIRREGDLAWTPRPPGATPAWRAASRAGLRRIAGRASGLSRWLMLNLREYAWHFWNPRIRLVLITGLAVALLLAILRQAFQFNLSGGLGIVSAVVGAVTGLWGVVALFTESRAPGSNRLAERLSLGGGDPLERFRCHFAETMRRVRRPVMVVVDDLDRCRPDFVVDLVRGIQTLLRSPRVVFVILGDRDWIERAFESHHEAMKAVDVGPEQSFGARFVEKAIQMSFILPALGADSREAYVRRVLLGAGAGAPAGTAAAAPAKAARVRVRAAAEKAVAEGTTSPFRPEEAVAGALAELGRAAPGESAGDREAAKKEARQIVMEVLAINAAVDDRVAAEVRHQLQDLAAFFPANPRQIKRIVNAITMYHAVALQRPGFEPDAAFRFQLALWVIVMTEWPRTWRLLASCPELADIVAGKASLAGLAPARRPGPLAATRREIERIRADSDLMALIAGDGDRRAGLETESIRRLAELTPLHSRKRRLAEEGSRVAHGRSGAGSGKRTGGGRKSAGASGTGPAGSP